MKKKAVSVILAATMAVSMLAGCGSDKQETQQESTSAATTESTDSTENGTQENEVNGIDISEPYEATMVLIGNQQADQDMVMEKTIIHIPMLIGFPDSGLLINYRKITNHSKRKLRKN